MHACGHGGRGRSQRVLSRNTKDEVGRSEGFCADGERFIDVVAQHSVTGSDAAIYWERARW